MSAHHKLSALLLVGLVGCTSPSGEGVDRGTIHITAPADGALITTASVEVTGTTTMDVEEVTVAGQAVPVEGGAFGARVILPEGPQRLTASAAGGADWVDITVDSRAPVVVVESPELGSFVEGDSLRIIGHVEDTTFQGLYLGDEPVPVAEDGYFDFELPVDPGAQRFRLRADDQAGHEGYGVVAAIVGHFASPSRTQPESAAISLGPDAMQTLAEAVQPELSSEAFQPLLLAANPIADGWWGTLTATGERHSRTQVGLTPRDGAIDVSAVLYDVEVPFEVDLRVGPTLHGTVYVSAASAVGSAALGVDGGYPRVDLGAVDVVLSGLLVDVSGLWSWVDRNIVTRAVRGTITEQIRTMVATRIPPMLDATLARMPSGQTVTVLDHELRIEGGFDSLAVTRQGLSATFDLSIRALHPDPARALSSPGTLVMGDGHAPEIAQDGVGAALSLDIINAALHAAWSTGELTYRKDQPVLESTGQPLTFAGLTLLAPAFRGQAPDDAPVSFLIDAKLPVVVQPGADGALLEVVAPDLRTEVLTVVDGVDQHLFTLSIGLRASISVALSNDEVAISIVDYAITADPVDLDEFPRGVPLGPDLDLLLQSLAAPVVAPFLDIGGLALPSLLGFSVSAPSAGLDRGYLVFGGSLAYDGLE